MRRAALLWALGLSLTIHTAAVLGLRGLGVGPRPLPPLFVELVTPVVAQPPGRPSAASAPSPPRAPAPKKPSPAPPARPSDVEGATPRLDETPVEPGSPPLVRRRAGSPPSRMAGGPPAPEPPLEPEPASSPPEPRIATSFQAAPDPSGQPTGAGAPAPPPPRVVPADPSPPPVSPRPLASPTPPPSRPAPEARGDRAGAIATPPVPPSGAPGKPVRTQGSGEPGVEPPPPGASPAPGEGPTAPERGGSPRPAGPLPSVTHEAGRSDTVGNPQGGGDRGPLAALPPGPAAPDATPSEYRAWLEAFRRRIQESLVYPSAAVRRRLVGTVRLEIRLRESGELGRVVLLRSSGHPALDEAAIRTVEAAGPFPFPAGLPPRALTIHLPVVFELR